VAVSEAVAVEAASEVAHAVEAALAAVAAASEEAVAVAAEATVTEVLAADANSIIIRIPIVRQGDVERCLPALFPVFFTAERERDR